jgi:hypothetical protein
MGAGHCVLSPKTVNDDNTSSSWEAVYNDLRSMRMIFPELAETEEQSPETRLRLELQ